MMHTKKHRAAALLTALAAVAGVSAISSVANATDQALGNATAPHSNSTMTPTSGSIGTTFQINLPAGSNICPGDTASSGYKVNTFIANRSVDVSTLAYGPSGPIAPSGTDYVRPLRNLSNANIININTAPTTGVVINASNFSWSAFSATLPPNGEYKIGVACTLDGVSTRYWQQPITVSGSGGSTFNWQQGWLPSAPTAFSASGGSATGGQITGSFAAPATAVPAPTSYTVTATPQGGGAPVSITPAAAGAYTITGLTNGTTYDVTVAATNSVGAGPAATVNNVLVNPDVINAANPFTATSGAPGSVVLNWTAPSEPAGATRTGYSITCAGPAPAATACAGSPFTAAAGATTQTVTGLAAGVYSFTIQATYDAPFTGGVASASAASLPNTVVLQEITVDRPAGALVLTQRCGVFGSAPQVTNNVFGTLPELPASPASADPNDGVNGWTFGTNATGTAPSVVTGTNPLTLGGLDGSNFGEYPYPVDANNVPNPTYPTHCGIDLGIGSLLTTGEDAGNYFAATGRINQITVVDTRDADAGWTLNGRMSSFVSTTDPTDTFHGNLLGWNPEVTWDSAPTLDGYDMTVVAGGVREPVAEANGDGLGDSSNSTNPLLSKALAKANAGAGTTGGLGMAVIDARLRLLIPVTADAGEYKGTLTFTTV